MKHPENVSRDIPLPHTMSALLLTAYKSPYKLTHSMFLPVSSKGYAAERSPNTIVDVPKTELEPNEVLIKTIAAGYCHGDLMIQNLELGVEAGDLPAGGTGLPMVPFHEGAGVIVRVGKGIDPNQLKVRL